MIDLVILVVLGFAAFRLTRLVVVDSIFEGLRAKFHTFLANFRAGESIFGRFFAFLAQKLLELTSCTWCAGVWLSFALYWVYVWSNPVDFSRFDWINVAAIAGVQGMLHSLEPEE